MPYITRGELRTYIGITGTNHDSVLDTYIEAASEACDLFTGRTKADLGSGFLTHTVSNERHWLDEEAHLVLGEWPVVSISSATLRGDSIVEDSDYFLKSQEGILTFFTGDETKRRETGAVNVSYIAGFATVPKAVKNCCLRLGSYWFARRQGEGMGAQLIGDIQETFRIPEVEKIMQEDIGRLRVDNFGTGSF